MTAGYRGRIAPSPTGHLHLGHARTFWIAQERARQFGGKLILRNEDLDPQRSKSEFVTAMLEDLRWFGFRWDEGPDVGGPAEPYAQSQRGDHYRSALARLQRLHCVYPCRCSRKDVLRAAQAPHAADDEPIYPGTCRPQNRARSSGAATIGAQIPSSASPAESPTSRVSWRFRIPDGETIEFHDGRLGPQRFVAGRDFGDFVVWRPDGVPSYQLAVVADDAAMGITEVVRGADLLLSTARQILLYRALEQPPPEFYHCPLVLDEHGERLAKRHASLSLRALRESGRSPEEIRRSWRLETRF